METDWVYELQRAQDQIRNINLMLTKLSEEESARLLRTRPIISILIIGCDFMEANLDVIRKQLARPAEEG